MIEFLSAWILAIIGIGLIVAVWQGWIKVTAKNMPVVYVIGAALILVNLATAGTFEALFVAEPTAPRVPTPTPTTPTTPISTVDTVTVSLSSHDYFQKASNSAGDYNHRVFLQQNSNWIDMGSYAEAATFTASPYDTIRVLYRFNETATDGSGNLTYPHMKEYQLPGTKGTVYFDEPVVNVDTSPSITLWTDDEEVNSNSSVQTMVANSEYSNRLRVRSSNNQCFGNYFHQGNGNVMCFQYNQTVVQRMELSGATMAPVPTMLTAVGGKRANCYYFPVVCNNEDWTGNVITTTASTAPTVGANHNPNIYIFDTSIDIDSRHLFHKPLIYGVEDEDGNDLGGTQNTVGGIFYLATV